MLTSMANLLDRARELLAGRPQDLSLVKIAAETGLDYSWLSKFSQGRIPNPGVKSVQTLHDYLVQHSEAAA